MMYFELNTFKEYINKEAVDETAWNIPVNMLVDRVVSNGVKILNNNVLKIPKING